MARKVVLAGACRTAIGVMGGTLSKTPAPDLGTVVIKEALKRTGIKPEQVDEVYMGCVIQAEPCKTGSSQRRDSGRGSCNYDQRTVRLRHALCKPGCQADCLR